MTKLNPNAGEYVPRLSSPLSTSQAVCNGTREDILDVEVLQASIAIPPDAEKKDCLPTYTLTYSIEQLMQYRSICNALPCAIPSILKAPSDKKDLKIAVHQGIAYAISDLMRFQPLYTKLPLEFTWTNATLPIHLSAKPDASKDKSARQKYRRERDQYPTSEFYDPNFSGYFNPEEYAAYVHADAAVYEAQDKKDNNVLEKHVKIGMEAEEGRRITLDLLSHLDSESMNETVAGFGKISITCACTLESIIETLLDHAIADPDHHALYAQLFVSVSEKTPEFREGPKTINFRRILLTKCYEALVEEADDEDIACCSESNGSTSAHLSWRKQCMLDNVGLIGELYRRHLLTENILHVCIAMMLEENKLIMPVIVEAACRLLYMVGDLLDGSSPASRRTMDEYFEVLQQSVLLPDTPSSLKATITEMVNTRSNGWIKKRHD